MRSAHHRMFLGSLTIKLTGTSVLAELNLNAYLEEVKSMLGL